MRFPRTSDLRHRQLLAMAALVAAVLLAACGGSEKEPAATPSPSPASQAERATSTPMPGATASSPPTLPAPSPTEALLAPPEVSPSTDSPPASVPSGLGACAGPSPVGATGPGVIASQPPPQALAGYVRGIYAIRSDGSEPRFLVSTSDGSEGDASPAIQAWSPNGSYIAFVGLRSSKRVLLLLEVATGRVFSLQGPDSIWDVSWDPLGSRLAVEGSIGEQTGVYMVPLDGGPATFFSGSSGEKAAAWSPNGQCLAHNMMGADWTDHLYVFSRDGTLLADLPDTQGPVWSPDGSDLAFKCPHSDSNVVCSWSLATEEEPRPVGDGWPVAWSPDGTRLLVAGYAADGRYGILVLPVDGGESVYLGQGQSPRWSPDGSSISFIQDGNLYVVSGSGEATPLTRSVMPFIAEPRWSPDGKTITFAFNAPPGDVYVAQADGSGERLLVPGGGPHWSPDGKRVAFIAGEGGLGFWGSVYVADVDGSSLIRLADVTYSDVVSPCRSWTLWRPWSPDGRYLTYDSDSGNNDWGGSFVVPADGSAPPQRIGAGFDPSWSPDGQEIALVTYDPRTFVCSVSIVSRTGGGLRTLTSGQAEEWSPDGKQIAFIRGDGVYRFNLAWRSETRLAGPFAGPAGGVAWSPDSRRLAIKVSNASGVIPGVVTYVVDLKGPGTAMLVGEGSLAAWSPDGLRLALWRSEGTENSIWLVNADGTGEPQRFLEGSSVEWSADGSRILFTR